MCIREDWKVKMDGVLRSVFQVVSTHKSAVIFGLVLGNLLFNIVANASFKVSAESASARGFLTWQVIGNLAGFITVLTLTGLLRFIPLHVAFTVTTGLAVIGVQLVAGKMIFGEVIPLGHWVGALFVILGIALLSRW